MNAIATAIQTEQLTGTAAEIAAAFAADVPLPYVTERWTYSGVSVTFGAQAAEGLGAAIRGAGLETAAIVYATTGFDLSLEETQQNLTAIASVVPALALVCEGLKAIGRPTSARWHRAGLESAPDEAACAVALAEIANPPVITYDRRAVLLSLNMDSAAMLSVRVVESGTVNGVNVTGSTLAQFGTADADNAMLTDAQRTMVDAVLAAMRAYTETL